MFASKNELFTPTSGGYNITRSLRFRSSASAYLNRTPASAGSQTTWTWSGWVKRGTVGDTENILFGANGSPGSYGSNSIRFSNADGSQKLIFECYNGAGADYYLISSAVYRDPSAWYHIVCVWDTTNATAANRQRVYVNGVQLTAYTTGNSIPLNATSAINGTIAHKIGSGTASYFDGYLAEVNFIDGQAQAPTAFGAFSIYNQWLPKKYAGTYGTNGFYLPFTNNASAATLGNDFSGNSNTWTTNNISVTAGSTYDSMTDVPTLTSATAANFAVLNPLTGGSSTTSDGNLAATIAPVNGARVSTIAVTSGKFYCEMVATTVNGYFVMGIGAPYSKGWDSSQESNPNSITWATSGAGSPYVQAKGSWTLSSNTISTTYTTGDVVGIALNMDSNTLSFYKNGTSQGSMTINTQGIPAAFLIGNSSGASNGAGFVNFGQRPFTYTPPTGYLALNTFNL